MRALIALATACLMLHTMAVCQGGEPKPTVSNDSLTVEQLAIYRVVLNNYRKGDKSAMNLSDRTDLLQSVPGSPDLACTNRIKAGDSTVVHRITDAAALGPGLVLADPDRQQEEIDKNDPQNLVKRAIDDHEKVTDKQLDETIKRAFETGLFSLSEIAFDKEHRYAVVAYSFVCGGLCGNGETLVLRRTGQAWKIVKHCSTWVS